MSQPIPVHSVDPIDDLVDVCDEMIALQATTPDAVPEWVLTGQAAPVDHRREQFERRYATILSCMQRPLVFGNVAAERRTWDGMLRLAREVGELIAARSAEPLERAFALTWHENSQCLFHRFGMIMAGQYPPLGRGVDAYVEKACAIAVVYYVRGEASVPSIRRYAGRQRHDTLMVVVVLAWLRALIKRGLFSVTVTL